MAIKFAKNVAREQENTALNITFIDGNTYNLDEIVANRQRNNPNSPLVMRVINQEDLINAAIAKMRNDLNMAITTNFSEPDVEEEIYKIIKDIFGRYEYGYLNLSNNFEINDTFNYNTNKLPFAAYKELKTKINNYLHGVHTELGYDYTIVIAGNTVTITWKFSNTDDLCAAIESYYETLQSEYQYSAETVSEGSLAISDTKGKIPVKMADYDKYLLDDTEDFSPKKENTFVYDENYSPSKINVYWEDGTQDQRSQDEFVSVYQEMEEIQLESRDKDREIQNLQNTINDKNIEIEELNRQLDADDAYEILEYHLGGSNVGE